MKRFLSTLTLAAALGMTPALLPAQDQTNPDIQKDEQFPRQNAPGATTNSQIGGSQQSSAGEAGGIFVHGGRAYILQPLQSEMSLPDGTKVQPDGSIVNRDGSTRSIGAGQMLSSDGQIKQSPFASPSGSSTMKDNTEGAPMKSESQKSNQFPSDTDNESQPESDFQD